MLNEPERRQAVINEREKLWFRSMKSKGRWRIRVCLISICCHPRDSKTKQTAKGKADALKLAPSAQSWMHYSGFRIEITVWGMKLWPIVFLFIFWKACSSSQRSLNLIFFISFQLLFFTFISTFTHLSHPQTKLNYQFIKLTNGIIYQFHPIIFYSLSSLLYANKWGICTYCRTSNECH